MTRRAVVLGGVGLLCIVGVGVVRFWGKREEPGSTQGRSAAIDSTGAERESREPVQGASSSIGTEGRRTVNVEADTVPEEVASTAPAPVESEYRSSPREAWTAAVANTGMIYDGTLEAEGMVDLALQFLEGADLGAPEWAKDGSVSLSLGEDPEFGSAAIHIYPSRVDGEEEFVLKMDLKEPPTYVGPSDSFLSSEARYSFGFPGEALTGKAYAYSLPVPSPQLFDHLSEVGVQSVGGEATFSSEPTSWKKMSLSLRTLPGGDSGMSQLYSEADDRYATNVPMDKEARLASILKGLRNRRP